MWLLWETGAMAVLLPDLAAFLEDEEATQGGAERFFPQDGRDRRHDPRQRPAPRRRGALDAPAQGASSTKPAPAGASRMRAAADFLDPIIERIAVPRRIADGVRRIVAILPRLSTGKTGRLGRTELMALSCARRVRGGAHRGGPGYRGGVQKLRAAEGGTLQHVRCRPVRPRRVPCAGRARGRNA